MSKRKYKVKKRKQRVRIAVLGEGITEWYYTNRLNQAENTNSSVKPSLPQSSNYKSVFKKATELLEQGFDKVICLMDMDVIQTSEKEIRNYGVQKMKLLKNSKAIILETMPCIEYWFLLHFIEYSGKVYPSCDEVILELKKHIPDYEKSKKYHENNDIYKLLIEEGNKEKAVEIACRLCDEMIESDNVLYPFTEIHLLLDELT